MPTVLDEIIDGVRADLAVRQALISMDELKARVQSVAPAHDAFAALSAAGAQKAAVTAGVKANVESGLTNGLEDTK